MSSDSEVILDSRDRQKVPGPAWYKVPYRIWKIRANPLAEIQREISYYGGLARLELASFNVYFIGHPDYINHILVRNSQNYSRLTIDYLAMRQVLGRGLVTTEGAEWLWQRQMLQPEFHNEIINTLIVKMRTTAAAVLAGWKEEIAERATIDVSAKLSDLALQIAANALFNVDSRTFPKEFSEAAVFVNRYADENAVRIIKINPKVPTPRNQLFKKSLKILDNVVYNIIEDYRKKGNTQDLTSIMINSTNPQTGNQLSDLEIRDQVLTLLITGHETSANGLTWTMYLLAKFPDIAAKVRGEVDSVIGSEEFSIHHIRKLVYTKRVIQESMRLYPPVWSVSRIAVAEDTIGPYKIPKNAYMYLSFYAVHHNPEFWEDPDQFEPDRFLPERVERQHKNAYLPFGAGPHLCIGREFAMMEMLVVLAHLLKSYEFNLSEHQTIIPEPLITLRPKLGVKMNFRERN